MVLEHLVVRKLGAKGDASEASRLKQSELDDILRCVCACLYICTLQKADGGGGKMQVCAFSYHEHVEALVALSIGECSCSFK